MPAGGLRRGVRGAVGGGCEVVVVLGVGCEVVLVLGVVVGCCTCGHSIWISVSVCVDAETVRPDWFITV